MSTTKKIAIGLGIASGALLAAWLLGETLSLKAMLGGGLILVAVLLLARGEIRLDDA